MRHPVSILTAAYAAGLALAAGAVLYYGLAECLAVLAR